MIPISLIRLHNDVDSSFPELPNVFVSQVDVSDLYKSQLCGVCTAPTSGNSILLNDKKIKEISVDPKKL